LAKDQYGETMTKNADSAGSGKNAFSVLMNSGNKKKRELLAATRPSRYILCPAGCGKHVADIEMNTHLDACIDRVTHLPCAVVAQRPNQEETINVLAKDLGINQNNVISPDDGASESSPSPKKSKPVACLPDKGGSNAFTLMMKRSSEVFSNAKAPKLFQRFHLGTDGCAKLTCYGSKPDDSYTSQETIEWTVAVELKDRPPKTDTTSQQHLQKQPIIIELVISSSIPSMLADTSKQLVHRHSRLSVPVLKSILQKSVRRRRPLPAVRVAMELGDKALGALLRRLSIIMFEDSVLHPDFPFLMWVMVAQTKGFELPPSLVQKVLQIVFEMASCPLQDFLDDFKEEEEEREDEGTRKYSGQEKILGSSTPSLGSFHQFEIDVRPGLGDTFIWATLLRNAYGGMSCDTKMLRLYASGWKHRFAKGFVQEELALRLPLPPSLHSATPPGVCLWKDVPTRIHASARIPSESRVLDLCTNGLDKLLATDLACEGVDFHCSPIVDILLKDQGLVQSCLTWLATNEDELRGLVPHQPAVLDGANVCDGRQRSWLEGIVKKCMWQYSAGVNHRRSLTASLVGSGSTTGTKDRLKCFWDELLATRSRAFSELYIQQRLTR
jgi:hypothetical protein